jgi:hypothetical protein
VQIAPSIPFENKQRPLFTQERAANSSPVQNTGGGRLTLVFENLFILGKYSEPKFLNFPGAQELILRNQFRQAV